MEKEADASLPLFCVRKTSQSASQTRPGCGTQHPLRFACVLLAAAPTTTPCFRHWRRSSLLPLPRGALGRPGSSALDARGPIWRKRAGLAAEGSGFWTTHLVKLPLPWTAEHYCFRDIVLCSSSMNLTDMPKALPLGELANEVRLRGQARDKRASARR